MQTPNPAECHLTGAGGRGQREQLVQRPGGEKNVQTGFAYPFWVPRSRSENSVVAGQWLGDPVTPPLA